MADEKYWAFISYSNRDERAATRLHRRIEGYRIPKSLRSRAPELPRRLRPVFRDREELPAATDLGEEIRRALRRSQYLIVVCSPHGAASEWVGREIDEFRALGREDRILAYIVDGDPPGVFHPSLLRPRNGESEGTLEPLAADARPGRDGSEAPLKVIAGLLGVGFDELKRRETQARMRRLATTALLAVVAMLATSSLAVWAMLERTRANKQTERVVAEQRKTLEKTVEATRRLDSQFTLNAIRQFRGADWPRAMPWLVEALRLHEEVDSPLDEAERVDVHRRRLGLLIRSSPRFVRSWEGQSNPVFSPDGTYVATSSGSVARVWEVGTGEPVTPELQHSDPVTHLRFAPDSLALLTIAGDRTGRNGKGLARIWQLPGGEPRTDWISHRGREKPRERVGPTDYVIRNAGVITDGIFSSDGTAVATCSDSMTVRVWDAATGDSTRPALEHPKAVRSVAFAPDGVRILTSCEDGKARFWSLETGEVVGEPFDHDWLAGRPAFSRDGAHIVTLSDGGAFVRDLDGTPVSERIQSGGKVLQAEFDPTGRLLVVADADGVRVWDVGSRRWTTPRMEQAGLKRFVLSKAGNVLLTLGDGARLWFAATGRPLSARLPQGRAMGDVSGVAPLCALSGGGAVTLWTLPEQTSNAFVGDRGLDGAAELSAGGRYLWSPPAADSGSTIRVVDPWSGRRVATVPLVGRITGWSRVGDRVATIVETTAESDVEYRVEVRTLPDGEPVRDAVTIGPRQPISRVVFAPDLDRLLAVDEDGRGTLWDLLGGERLAEISLDWPIRAAAFDESGERLACVGGVEEFPSSGQLQLWDVESGTRVGDEQSLRGYGTQVLYLSDGETVATASHERNQNPGLNGSNFAGFWSAETGVPLSDPIEIRGAAADPILRFDATERFLLSGGRLLRVPTGEPALDPGGGRMISAVSKSRPLLALWSARPGRLALHDLEGDRARPLPLLQAGNLEPLAVGFGPRDRVLAALFLQSTPGDYALEPDVLLQVWDVATGEPLAHPQYAGVGRVQSAQLAFAESGDRLACLLSTTYRSVTWRVDLAPATADQESLETLAEFLSDRTVDRDGGLELLPLDGAEAQSLRESRADSSVADVPVADWTRSEVQAAAMTDRPATVALLLESHEPTEASTSEVGSVETLAHSLSRLGRWRDAHEAFSRAVEVRGPEPRLLEGRAVARARLGLWDDALGDFRKASARAPIRKDFVYAGVLAEVGRTSEAVQLLSRYAPTSFARYVFEDDLPWHVTDGNLHAAVVLADFAADDPFQSRGDWSWFVRTRDALSARATDSGDTLATRSEVFAGTVLAKQVARTDSPRAKDFLDAALTASDRMAGDSDEDTFVLTRLARTYLDVGSRLGTDETSDAADACRRSAHRIAERLMATRTEDPNVRDLLISTANALGDAARQSGERQEAMTRYLEALRHTGELPKPEGTPPDRWEYRLESKIGSMLLDADQPNFARHHVERSRDIAQQRFDALFDLDSTHWVDQDQLLGDLAYAEQSSGRLHSLLGDDESAASRFEAACVHRRNRLEIPPHGGGSERRSLSIVLGLLASARERLDEVERARAALDEKRRADEEVTKSYDAKPADRWALVGTLERLAGADRRLGNTSAAEDYEARRLAILSSLADGGDVAAARLVAEIEVQHVRERVADDPESLPLLRKLSNRLATLGELDAESGDNELARTRLEESVAIARRVLGTAPDDLELVAESADRLGGLGSVLLQLDDLPKLVEIRGERVALLRRLLEDAPENAEVRRDLASDLKLLADVAWQQGDPNPGDTDRGCGRCRPPGRTPRARQHRCQLHLHGLRAGVVSRGHRVVGARARIDAVAPRSRPRPACADIPDRAGDHVRLRPRVRHRRGHRAPRGRGDGDRRRGLRHAAASARPPPGSQCNGRACAGSPVLGIQPVHVRVRVVQLRTHPGFREPRNRGGHRE